MPELDFVVKEETGIRVQVSLGDIKDLIDELELVPEDIFDEDHLIEWAKDNGFKQSE